MRAEFAVIRQQLDASRLLAELSHSHGVLPAKYRVSVASDGSARIQAGKRRLNVSDFLTKELHLPWPQASQILRGCYSRQEQGLPPPRPYEAPRTALWRAYVVERDAQLVQRRQAWTTQRASEQARRAAIRDGFLLARKQAAADLTLTRGQRRAATSVARLARAQSEASLAVEIAAERESLSIKTQGKSFEAFLRERAQGGDAQALEALRSARRPVGGFDPSDVQTVGIVRPAAPAQERNEIVFAGTAFSWEVQRNGDVVYRSVDVDVMRDTSDAVQVLQFDRVAIEAGLRMAQARFGRTLALEGSEAFRLEAARVAADVGLYVEFSDDALNQAMNARRAAGVEARLDGIAPTHRQGSAVAPAAPGTPSQLSQDSVPGADASVKPKTGPTLG